MLLGPTGSGKTAFIKDYMKTLPMEKYLQIFVNFSATSLA
jgi:Ni2+-binding GTPase involved in maturation of urease and hydrogenase